VRRFQFISFLIILTIMSSIVPVTSSSSASMLIDTGPVTYEYSVRVTEPYNGSVWVSLRAVYINESYINENFVMPVCLREIVLSHDYGSKVYKFNYTFLYNFSNGDFIAYNYSFHLYFPVDYTGALLLNVSLVLTWLVLIAPLDVCFSLCIQIHVLEKFSLERALLYALLVLVIGETVLLVRKR